MGMSRRFRLSTRPYRLDPTKRQIVGDDDFVPVIPGRDPTLPVYVLADDDENIVVDDDDNTSGLVEGYPNG